MLLYLRTIDGPQPTDNQIMWLNTVYSWGLIPKTEYLTALTGFNAASECIAKYYQLAHAWNSAGQ